MTAFSFTFREVVSLRTISINMIAVSYRSSSAITLIPFLFNNAVATPSPGISFPENEPSYI